MLDNTTAKTSSLEDVIIADEQFYKITNYDAIPAFLMSIVSDSNHWMFISSNGGLTAGRKNAEFAIFPYYTDDKLTELVETTGSKSIFWVSKSGESKLWEPFSERQSGQYNISRNLYKNLYGNKVMFEEINHDLELTWRYQWNSSNKYGFVRKAELINTASDTVEVKMLDGIQNIMPYGVTADLQAIRSNLVDAYKKCELDPASGVGIYALSAIIVDRAEPSEALKANTVWSVGVESPSYLLSSFQLDKFRAGHDVQQEEDIKARKGAYFLSKTFEVAAGNVKEWQIVANVNQTAASISETIQELKSPDALLSNVEVDIKLGSQRLVNLVSASDGFQQTSDKKRDARHYSNTLFNIMRGGIFDDSYKIEKWDFSKYLKDANREVFASCKEFVESLADEFTLQDLRNDLENAENVDLVRLAMEYMPLKFSRRHGDPSRPWNKFSINTRNEKDGSKVLDYEGNWRDIFQNWEALAHSYPEFIDNMILKFLNASTFDGYNPYRVTKDGFDWEVIEEHDPWSYIGYWGDHQIIYLLKFLEFIQDHDNQGLSAYFEKDLFVYANVPYKIKGHEDILKDPKDTIEFDDNLDREIRSRRAKLGSDGALLSDHDGNIHRVNFIEKILATTLAKMSNLIPEAGIWLNTQRPEWNDANNALVGNGVSMVTLSYLRRFLAFFDGVIETSSIDKDGVPVSEELLSFFRSILSTLIDNEAILDGAISDSQRGKVLDGLGRPAGTYRSHIYQNSFSGKKEEISFADIKTFLNVSLKYLEHSIKANKRDDGMYHAYNLMTVKADGGVAISYLDEMLEGQVAVLSSEALSAQDSLEVLDAMKVSKLFRPDQYSYLLYPNKELPRFLDKNIISEEQINSSSLLKKMVEDGNKQLVEQDIFGHYHFNGNFNNASFLKVALEEISEGKYAELIKEDASQVLSIFEEVFNHKAFTGRSGTFFGYEGLGSIYWHMVSKLLLAVEETCLRAVDAGESAEIVGRLLEHYYEINAGIGVHKSPELYGAFSIDPYSHTPTGKGAQQPGMTGQVKEDILSRIGELGVFVSDGQLCFNPCLLRKEEFLTESTVFKYVDLGKSVCEMHLEAGSLAFAHCQVPVIYQLSKSGEESISVNFADGSKQKVDGLKLDKAISTEIFRRSGAVSILTVSVNVNRLK